MQHYWEELTPINNFANGKQRTLIRCAKQNKTPQKSVVLFPIRLLFLHVYLFHSFVLSVITFISSVGSKAKQKYCYYLSKVSTDGCVCVWAMRLCNYRRSRRKRKRLNTIKRENMKKYFFALFGLCIVNAFSFTYASRVFVCLCVPCAPQTTQHHCQEVKYVCRRVRERKGMVWMEAGKRSIHKKATIVSFYRGRVPKLNICFRTHC